MKRFSKAISILLCLIMIITSLPMNAIAAETDKESNEKDETVSVVELVEKRDIYSKTYETSNGTNVVIMSAAPLHYEKDGELVEIDNTLIKSDDDSSVLTNKSNVYSVELPKKMTDDSIISLDYDDNEINFKLVNENLLKAKADITKEKNTEVDESKVESVAYSESNIESLTSSITYKNILKDTDFAYTVTPNTLKEKIILNALPDDNYTISYEFSMNDNLCAVLNKDNSISILDNAKNEVFLIESPYMYDDSENESDDIIVTLDYNDKKYTITYTPNIEWLSSSTIVYPVTIDPTVKIYGKENNVENIEDTYICSSTTKKNRNYSSVDNIIVYKKQNSESWGCVKINTLGTIPEGTRLLNASLNFNTKYDLNSVHNLALYEASDDFNFSTTPLTMLKWTSGLTSKPNAIDVSKPPQIVGLASFDITNYVYRSMYDTANEVLVIKALTTDDEQVEFASNITNSPPYISIEYQNDAQIGNAHSKDMGLAGTARVNDCTGELVIERTDFASKTNLGDVTFLIGDNVNTPEGSYFGDNVSLNYYKTIEECNLDDANYKIVNGDGSTTYIGSGDGYTITPSQKIVDNNTVSVLSVYRDIDESQAEETVFTKYMNAYVFTEYTVVDKSDNNNIVKHIVADYRKNPQTNQYKLTYLKDDILSVTFNYNQLLSSINIALDEQDDNPLLDYIDYDNDSEFIEEIEVEYSYSNNTYTVSYNDDDDELSVIYNETGNNTLAVYGEFETYYLYTFDNHGRVINIKECASQDEGDEISFSYAADSTTITDGTYTITEHFDYLGNVVSIIDQNGNAIMAKHDDGNFYQVSNTRNSARNICTFYNFESNSDTSFDTDSGNVNISTDEKYNGNSSVKLSCPSYTRADFEMSIDDLQLNSDYTISVWIKKMANTDCHLRLQNGNSYSVVQSGLSEDWQLLYGTINTGNSDDLDISIITDNSHGNGIVDVYADYMCIQKSSTYYAPNLLVNGDFANGTSNWFCGDSIQTTSDNSNISTLDNNRLVIEGNLGNKEVIQYIPISNSSGAKYNFGGWAKAINSLPCTNGARSIGISVYGVKYQNGVEDTNVVPHDYGEVTYSSNFSNWQYLENEFELNVDYGNNSNYNALKFVISYNNQLGSGMFDGLYLSEGQLFEKRVEGNIPTFNLMEKHEDEITGTDNVLRKWFNLFRYIGNTSLLYETEDSFHNTTNYYYDYYGNIARVDDPDSKTIEYTYDYYQNLSSVKDTYYQTTNDNSVIADNIGLYVDNLVKFSSRAQTLNNLLNGSASIDLTGITQENLHSGYSSTTIQINYDYKGKRLESIQTLSSDENDPINTFDFQYDKWNNIIAIYVNDDTKTTPFIHYNYNTNNYRQLDSVEYINGQEIHFAYDNNGNLIYEYDTDDTDGDTLAYSYYYYNDGTCYGKKNLITGTYESYQNDVITTLDSSGNILQSCSSDSDNNEVKSIDGNSISISYSNNDNSKITNINNTEYKIVKTNDAFGRISSEKIMLSANNYPYILKKYSYYGHGVNATDEENLPNNPNGYIETCGLIRYVSYYLVTGENQKTDINQFRNLFWLNGNNLFSTTATNWSSGTEVYSSPAAHTYNTTNMLMKNYALYDGKRTNYHFDAKGNINAIRFEEWVGTGLLNSSLSDKYLYELTYDNTSTDSVLNDCVTEVKKYDLEDIVENNQTTETKVSNFSATFQYDELGNTTNITEIGYNNHPSKTLDFTWTRGNVLDSVELNNYESSFQYNDSDIRTSKTTTQNNNIINDVVYYWEDNKLVGQKIAVEFDEAMHYYDVIILYDQNECAYGFVLNEYNNAAHQTLLSSHPCYYVKDSRNTIMSIVSVEENNGSLTGHKAVEFLYDDYGMPSAEYDDDDYYLLLSNPLIYRDNIYDMETQMYYMNSRYYAPEIGRYISANNYLDNGSGTIMSTNPYAYCENDPINNIDYDGRLNVSFRYQLRLGVPVAFSKKGVRIGENF